MCTVTSAFFACFLILHWETAIGASIICLVTFKKILDFYNRVWLNFDFDENTEAIDLNDMFTGPANIVSQQSNNMLEAVNRARGIRTRNLNSDGRRIEGGLGIAENEEVGRLLDHRERMQSGWNA